MTLFLSERDVQQLLTPADAVDGSRRRIKRLRLGRVFLHRLDNILRNPLEIELFDPIRFAHRLVSG